MGKRVKSSNKKTISLRQYAGFGGARLSILTVRNKKTDWMQSSDDMNCVNPVSYTHLTLPTTCCV